MLRLAEVQTTLPESIGGTKIRHLGEEHPGVWYAWDADACVWYCRDIDGAVVFHLDPVDLVCIETLYIDWARCAEDPHRVMMRVNLGGPAPMASVP